jgi:hypothetical protein
MARILTVAGFALATAAATLAVAWPTPTHADGASPLVQYMVDGCKIGDVIARGVLRKDATAKSGWVVLVTADNGADHGEEVPLETDVTRLVMSPMARVPPRPQTVWSTKEQVTVPAHGSVTRRYEIPAAVATQIAAAASAKAKSPPTKGPLPAAIVSFAVSFDQSTLQQPVRPAAVFAD